jgi:hypothetical protein
MNHPHALPLTHDHLTDGYISYTFGPQNAEDYIRHLVNANPTPIWVVRHQSGAFYTFNQPAADPHFIPPAVALYGRHAWLLDYGVRLGQGFGGSVVPQQIWFPQGQGDRRRYVDQARFRLPMFFLNANGSLGVPVLSAAEGHMQLRDVVLPAQLADKSTIKIRINVCARSLPAHSPPSLTVCTAVARL